MTFASIHEVIYLFTSLGEIRKYEHAYTATTKKKTLKNKEGKIHLFPVLSWYFPYETVRVTRSRKIKIASLTKKRDERVKVLGNTSISEMNRLGMRRIKMSSAARPWGV